MRVQDYFGNPGTVRWVGRLEKANHPPANPGTYAAVQFDEPNASLTRTDGSWNGVCYVSGAAPGTVEFRKPATLGREMNTSAIADLRAHFGERIAHLHDVQLIKFSIARQYNMPKVYEMMEKNLRWVAEYNPRSTLLQYFPPEMALDYPVGFGEGTDREGNLLYFERPGNAGRLDPTTFVARYTIPVIVRWHVAGMELGKQMMADSNYKSRRVCGVIDLTKLGKLDRSVFKFAKALSAVDQDNYPEHLAKLFIINAPGFFVGVWKLIRVFVDDRTKAKIHVLSASDTKRELEEQIDPKYLPSFAGGSNDSWTRNGGIAGSADPTSKVAVPLVSIAEPELDEGEDMPSLDCDTSQCETDPKSLDISSSEVASARNREEVRK